MNWLNLSVAITLFSLMQVSFAADQCIAVRAGTSGSAILKVPGNYCLERQLRVDGKYVPWVWEGPKYLSDDDIALVIATNDTHLDLQGHTILSNARAVTAGVQSAISDAGKPASGAPR